MIFFHKKGSTRFAVIQLMNPDKSPQAHVGGAVKESESSLTCRDQTRREVQNPSVSKQSRGRSGTKM